MGVGDELSDFAVFFGVVEHAIVKTTTAKNNRYLFRVFIVISLSWSKLVESLAVTKTSKFVTIYYTIKERLCQYKTSTSRGLFVKLAMYRENLKG